MRKLIVSLFVFFILCNSGFAQDIPVKLQALTKITTSNNTIQEGDFITLEIAQDVFVNSKLFIKQGERATGVITSLENNDFISQPASIYAENFRTVSVDGQTVKLDGIIYKSGRNHSYMTQYLENGFQLIRGGEAKIDPKKDKFILYLKEPKNDKVEKEQIDAL